MRNTMSLTGRLISFMATATDGTESGGAGGFSPNAEEQGVGLFNSPAEMRKVAEQQQATEEETGSLSEEKTAKTVNTDPVDVTDKDSSKDSSEGSSDGSINESSNESGEALEGDTGFTYKGVSVEVTNTPELVEAFKGAGLDINKVNKELFSDEGLSGETKAVLDKAFGKGVVDMYIEGWANKHDAALATAEAEVAQANADVGKVLTEIAGDKSSSVFQWANDNLSEEEYKEYADVINGSNKTAMKLAFKELTSRSGVLAPDVMGKSTSSVRKTAISPDTVAPSGTEVGLSLNAYLQLFEPGEGGVSPYWGNEEKYDALRELGRQQGI